MIHNQNISDPVSHSAALPEVGAIYRHYKGNCYRVIALSRHSETHDIHVVYQALYDSPQFCVPGEASAKTGSFAVWVRPLSLFMDTVVINGAEMPRFERVS